MSKLAIKSAPARSFKNVRAIIAEGENDAFDAPYFNRHMQQVALTTQDYFFDYEDLQDPVQREQWILTYLVTPEANPQRKYQYVSKALEEYLCAPVQPKRKVGNYVTPDFAKPMSRLMAILLRHYAAGMLFDVTTEAGCEAFYSYFAVQLVRGLHIPFSLVPDFVFDYLAAPHPSFPMFPGSKLWLSQGMIELWRCHFKDLPLAPDSSDECQNLFDSISEAVAVGTLDPRFMPKALGANLGISGRKLTDADRPPYQAHEEGSKNARSVKMASDVTLIGADAQIASPGVVIDRMAKGFEESGLDANVLRDAGSTSPINIIALDGDKLIANCMQVGLGNLEQRYNIGYFLWNTSTLSRAHEVGLPILDEIWVPSNFLYNAHKDNKAGVPVYLQSLPISAPVIPTHMDRRYFGLRDDVFYFVFTSDTAANLSRQNPEAIAEAFHRAFPKQQDVGLILKIQNAKHKLDASEGVASMRVRDAVAGDARIHYNTQLYRDIEVSALINVADCYVSLHRCEGLGVAMLDAMALGKPLIATGWSGNADFTTPETACPVNYDLININAASFGYLDNEVGHIWADASIDHAAEWMQKLYRERALAKEIGLKGQKFVRERYSPQTVLAGYEKRLQEIRTLMGIE